jgi:hypothetical protein
LTNCGARRAVPSQTPRPLHHSPRLKPPKLLHVSLLAEFLCRSLAHPFPASPDCNLTMFPSSPALVACITPRSIHRQDVTPPPPRYMRRCGLDSLVDASCYARRLHLFPDPTPSFGNSMFSLLDSPPPPRPHHLPSARMAALHQVAAEEGVPGMASPSSWDRGAPMSSTAVLAPTWWSSDSTLAELTTGCQILFSLGPPGCDTPTRLCCDEPTAYLGI